MSNNGDRAFFAAARARTQENIKRQRRQDAVKSALRHGTDLDLTCRQCGTSWRYDPDSPTQCPDCLDHLGEPAASPRRRADTRRTTNEG
jgi:rubrerythrin